jgi:basic amino acid/polyamine antiporter, APA family
MAELKRVLGFWTILSLAVASIMGTGMFFSVSVGSKIAGPGFIIAWVLLTLVGLYIAAFFGELSAMYPRAGGIYEFSKQAYSRVASFMVGWTAWLIGNIGVALTVVAAIDYIMPGHEAWAIKLLVSVVFIILLNVIAFYGIEASAFVLVLFAIVAFTIVISIVVPGTLEFNSANLFPLLPFGISSVFLAMFFLSESFFGWESVTYLAEETKNPERVIPKALLWGTVIVGLMGTSLAVVSLGIVKWDFLAQTSAPLSFVASTIFGEGGVKFVSFGIFVTLIGSAAGGIITMPRLLLALARDKLFISQLAEVHPTYNTPHKAIIFQTILSIVIFLMAFGRYEQLLNMVLPIGFLLYFFTILIVFKLRVTHPHANRPFKVPFAKFGSIAISTLLAVLLYMWMLLEPGALHSFSLALSFILLGIPIYLLLEMYYDPEEIIRITDSLAYFTLWLEAILLPPKVRKNIMFLLGKVENKNILEFGCSVGTLTLQLAEAVKPNGKVFATDLSKKEIDITKKRMLKHGHFHVISLHDEHQINRVHPYIPHVDAIVSVGMLGYLQDTKKVLTEMKHLLPNGGRVVFVDYADFFGIIPNVEWLSNDANISKAFKDAGFSVFVRREKGLFWNYVYVYGIKYYENIPYA